MGQCNKTIGVRFSRFGTYQVKVILGFLLVAISSTAQADLVKKSKSGICHDQSSAYYDKTKNFKPYNSLKECLDSGGRLPKNSKSNAYQESKKTTASSGYSRDKFGKGWSEGQDPNDCMNTRHELLKQLSTSTIDTGSNRCTVERGRWYCPYTGRTFHNSRQVDVDHIVPLAFSWSHGADRWSQNKREQFANDPSNLIPVEASANRQKGAKAPWDWMPPDKSYHCQYLLRFTRIVKTYGLKLSSAEKKKLEGVYEKGQCRVPRNL